MIRKSMLSITSIALVALIALASSQRNSVAAQTVNSTLLTPRVHLDITNMELFAPNSMTLAWTVQKTGIVTIDRYTITLVLSRDGVTEQVTGTASGASKSATVDLRGISAANRAGLFGPNLKVTAILKADFTGRTSGGLRKFVSQIQETRKYNASPIAQ